MINNVVLVGRLTKDPDLRYTASGSAVATFTLAVNRNFTNQNGDREADFINCVIWRKPAETMANYARKGTLLGVVGRIQTRNYENQQGQRVYVTEVVCENFQLLESLPCFRTKEELAAVALITTKMVINHKIVALVITMPVLDLITTTIVSIHHLLSRKTITVCLISIKILIHLVAQVHLSTFQMMIYHSKRI